MTAAMFDEMASRENELRHNAALLRPGTLIFLWRPGDRPWHGGAEPVMARVKTGRTDSIEAVDTRDGAEGVYDVAADPANPGRLRWIWEIAAPPERPACPNGVERIDGGHMPLDERVRLICGEPGKNVRMGLRDGSSVSGVLTSLMAGPDPEAWEAEWAELTGPTDSRGQIKHWVRVGDIISITRTDA